MSKLTNEMATKRTKGYSQTTQTTDLTILLVSAAMIGMVYVLAQNDQTFLYLLSNGLPPILAFGAFAMATAGLLRNGVNFKNRISTVWLCYSIGILLWLLGESTWGVYALWYSVPTPFPSIADVFWLAGYIPLLGAIVLQAWPFREFFTSKKMLATSLVVVALAAVLLGLLIPETYASAVGSDLVSVVIDLAYPLLDISLLLVAVPILLLFMRGSFWRPFLFVTFGLILTFVGDILFTWTTLNNVYYDGSYLELFFLWSYLVLAYGFYLKFRRGIKVLGPS